ncbi:hypothetical protein BUALT_Bualt11G0069700 [Buddleja alternifolia]|uniref:Uncharacterized protein n=1 Tax=Buddleja alternifolia TaxID=168488 RepID=A0AAV6WXX6_9LAMI|nr:hypothetical protein BUALT_Bualt11G0069700 [Buddleja alternifolia]
MDALSSPIEGLIFNYLSYGVSTAVNNIWAWVAVITAAVSFWGLRALSSPLVSTRGGIQDDASLPSTPPEMAAVEVRELATVSSLGESERLLSASNTTTCCVLEREGSSKVKFSLYFDEDGSEESGDDGDDNGGGAVEVSEKLGFLHNDVWRRMMVVKMGDMGWYRCQDLTVLNGSVVRLWDN